MIAKIFHDINNNILMLFYLEFESIWKFVFQLCLSPKSFQFSKLILLLHSRILCMILFSSRFLGYSWVLLICKFAHDSANPLFLLNSFCFCLLSLFLSLSPLIISQMFSFFFFLFSTFFKLFRYSFLHFPSTTPPTPAIPTSHA